MYFRTFMKMLVLSIIVISCDKSKETIPVDLKGLVANSPLIFNGTVKLLNTSTIDADDVSDLMVVQVNDILSATDEFSHLGGKLITLQTDQIASYSEEQSRVFITDRWVFGESIAVRNLGDMEPAIESDRRKKLMEEIETLREQQQMDSLRKLLANAEVVITGQVIKVEEIANTSGKESEHDPRWSAATIKVTEGLKGMGTDGEITIIFSASKDVMWFGAPKFRIEDTGVWILSKKGKEVSRNKDLEDLYFIYSSREFVTDETIIDQIRTILK